MSFSVLSLISCYDPETLLEHCVSNQNLSLVGHCVALITVSRTFFLTFPSRPNEPGFIIALGVGLQVTARNGSQPSTALPEFFLDTPWNRKKYPFSQRDLTPNSFPLS